MSEGQSSPYPVRLDIDYPRRLSRWLIFVKWILVIPHFIVLSFFWLAAALATLAAFAVIVFTRRYPANLFAFVVEVQQWTNRVLAYLLLLRDEYPPFTIPAAARVGGPLLIIVTGVVGSLALFSAAMVAGILGLALAVDEIRPDLIACERLPPGEEYLIQTGYGPTTCLSAR